jgi:hypothetical protein
MQFEFEFKRCSTNIKCQDYHKGKGFLEEIKGYFKKLVQALQGGKKKGEFYTDVLRNMMIWDGTLCVIIIILDVVLAIIFWYLYFYQRKK